MDTIELYGKLRAQTAQLLGFGDTTMTAAQVVRLDRVTTLRLLADAMQARVVRGENVDIGQFNETMSELETLLGGNPEQTTSPNYGAALEVEAMIDGLLRARAQADVKRDADTMFREEQAAILAAGGDVSLAAGAPPAVDGRAQTGDASSSSSSAAPEPPPPQRVESDTEKMARVNNQPPPPHYLKGPPEPWRAFSHWFI